MYVLVHLRITPKIQENIGRVGIKVTLHAGVSKIEKVR